MLDNREISDALALLAWQHAAGVDAAVGSDPIDWTSRRQQAPGHDFEWPDRGGAGSIAQSASAPASTLAEPKPKVSGLGEPARPRAQTPLAPSEAETEARRAAAAARTLDELEAALRRFDGCGLKATATKLCFYRGSPSARLMLIGEAPGREEDLEGKPFVGRAGQLLDKMLAAIGLGEADVHITNSSIGVRPGIARQRRKRRSPAGRSWNVRWSLSRRISSWRSADRRRKRFLPSRKASCDFAANGGHSQSPAATFWRSRPCTQPICCARLRQSSSRGSTS